MTDDTKLAFANPELRAMASESQPRDRIFVRDHIVTVEIGAFQAERGTTQRIRFDVVVEVREIPADLGDDVDRILSYDRVTEAIEAELSEERLNLLETLAERVADRILTEPQAMRAFVRIEKLDRGPGTLGVEIERSRPALAPSLAPQETAKTAPVPHVVFLSNSALETADLKAGLDGLIALGQPLILTVGAADVPAPQSAAPLAQRRVDLLAIEQNAWVLAGRDRRCVVVDTKTELDWGMRHGQVSVWAPSKIVLDAVDGPPVGPKDAEALARWFAEDMGATTLHVIDRFDAL